MYGHIIYLDRKRVGGNASLLRRTNYAHIRTCSLYGGRVMQGRQAGRVRVEIFEHFIHEHLSRIKSSPSWSGREDLIGLKSSAP